MKLTRNNLVLLLNALHSSGERRITVSHPSPEIGNLLEIDIDKHRKTSVRFERDETGYGEARSEVSLQHGEHVAEELPEAGEYVKAFVAGGVTDHWAGFLVLYLGAVEKSPLTPMTSQLRVRTRTWRSQRAVRRGAEQDRGRGA